MKRIQTLLFALCAMALLVILPKTAAASIQSGLSLCAGAILPGLFPFFVLSELWLSTGGADRAAVVAAPVMERVFHLPGSAAPALLLGAVGGYPTGAATAARLYEQGHLSRGDAECLLRFCNNAGPAFLISVVGSTVLQSIPAGAALYGVHLAAALLIGLLLRPADRPSAGPPPVTAEAPPPFSQCFTGAVTRSIGTAIRVCGFVLLFSLLTGLAGQLLPVRTPPLLRLLLLGPLEMTGGVHLLVQAVPDPRLQFTLCAVLAGFGGLCVYLQTLSFLSEAGLSGRPLLIGKLLHAALSGLLAWALWPLLPTAAPCMALSVPNTLFPVVQLLLVPIFLLFWSFAEISSGKPAQDSL